MQRMQQFGGMEKTAQAQWLSQLLSHGAPLLRGGGKFLGEGFGGLATMLRHPIDAASAGKQLFGMYGTKGALKSLAPQITAAGLGAAGLYGAGRLGLRALGMGAKQTARQALTHGGLQAWWKAQPLMQKAIVGAGAGGLAMGTGMGLANRVVGGRS